MWGGSLIFISEGFHGDGKLFKFDSELLFFLLKGGDGLFGMEIILCDDLLEMNDGFVGFQEGVAICFLIVLAEVF